MRELRLLKQDADSSALVFGTDEDDEQFVLKVDDMVRAAVHFDVAHAKTRRPADPPAAAPAPAPSPVTPREIQMRVRAGEAPEAIAEQYGVDLGRIMRFAAPVVEERVRITTEARRSRARRGPGDGRTVIFGDFVDRQYAAHGVDVTDVAWDSRRRDDGEWIIAAKWDDEGDRRAATWLFHRSTRTVSPADETAATLLSDRPLQPMTPPPGLLSLAPGVVPFPPMPQADTGPIPVVEEVFDQENTFDQPRTRPATPASAPEPSFVPIVASGEGADDFGTPALPLGLGEPQRRKSERRPGGRQARTKVPSWDDILLGVRPKSE